MPLDFSDADIANMNGHMRENIDVSDQTSSKEVALSTDVPVNNDTHLEPAEEDIFSFDPPLYIQRYTEVRDLLDAAKVLRVADFGSAEGKIITYFKRIQTMQELNAVDLDATLSGAKGFCSPLITDYVMPRTNPFVVKLWQGDATKFDSRFQNLDAITMVEVIEHLNPEVLEALPENLFGRLHPRMIILTTPNAEFNVLFPNFSGFRHWDHKFEWTRAEFQSWCTEQARTYDYDVSFSGVGAPPPDRADVGHCSQTAVFTRKSEHTELTNGCSEEDEPYKLLHEVEHPWKAPPTLEEDILYEARFYLRRRAQDVVAEWDELLYRDGEEASEECQRLETGEWYDADKDVAHVALAELMKIKKIADLCDLEKLRSVMMSSDEFVFSDDKCFILHHLESPEFHDSEYDAPWNDDTEDYAEDINDETMEADNGEVMEDWGDDTESNQSDKPWNDPANWNLPLEVSNPEMVENMRKTGAQYRQGFHVVGPESQRTKFERWTHYLVPGQTDDVESDSEDTQKAESEGVKEEAMIEKLSEMNIADRNTDNRSIGQGDSAGQVVSCDAPRGVNCSEAALMDFRVTPLDTYRHYVYTIHWYQDKGYYDIEEGQFDLD